MALSRKQVQLASAVIAVAAACAAFTPSKADNRIVDILQLILTAFNTTK
mgnify:FL=1